MHTTNTPITVPIKIGVSSCLLGEKVRYDGGHKLDHYITDTLGHCFSFVPVCPEVGCGLPVPREAMRLEGDPANPRLMTIRTRLDLTGQMLAFCDSNVRELAHEDLCGFIFKKNSPSCGIYRVSIYNNGLESHNGSGLFAAAVARQFPALPMIEESDLGDPIAREGFLDRVCSYRPKCPGSSCPGVIFSL